MDARKEIAKRLADFHYRIEPGISRIFTIRADRELEARPTTPIRLLEVNENTPASGILPLYFGPAPDSGIPYPSVIIEVTPAEFEEIRSHKLKLPDGWLLDEEFFRPIDANGDN